MSTVQRIAGMPVLVLENGSQIVLEAIHPTTGAQVSGVDIRGVAITYEPGTAASTAPPPDVFLAHLPTSV
jgi:hypothetical protein